MFLYAAMAGQRYDSVYEGKFSNPILGLSIDEAIEEFDEDSVHTLMVAMKAYNLHALPLSSDIPAFEVIVDETVYAVRVVDGRIFVKEGFLERKDIVIRTTIGEAVAMLQDPTTIQQSFLSGKSSIEYVTDGSTLLYKRYYVMTSNFNGNGLTGNVVRGYFS